MRVYTYFRIQHFMRKYNRHNQHNNPNLTPYFDLYHISRVLSGEQSTFLRPDWAECTLFTNPWYYLFLMVIRGHMRIIWS